MDATLSLPCSSLIARRDVIAPHLSRAQGNVDNCVAGDLYGCGRAEVVAAVPEAGVRARRTDEELVGATRQVDAVIAGDVGHPARHVGAAGGAGPSLVDIDPGVGHDRATGVPHRPTEDRVEAEVQ